ncbi:MAG TPA: Fur family transcriptional regulator [Candidatus Limnocylindrales bacterium]|nr:Fur family transcriptional regulator [Candidatus Limnocylindrales bacterium]
MDTSPTARALDQAGYRLTRPRLALAELVDAQDGHFTAADLFRIARARRLGVSRATLFRLVEVLTELRLLERVDLPGGEHAYVRCAPRHHHHVICTQCGRATEIDDQSLADAVAEISRLTGYRIDTHRLEMFGRCWRCDASAEPAS